jgi:hypothetical protein
MTKAQIIELQTRIGTTPDGFWGPKSIAAVQKHLRAMMPKDNPWPKSDQASLIKFYGQPGEHLTSLKLPFTMKLYGAENPITAVTVHEKCADSLRRVLVDLYDRYYLDADIMKAASAFFGIYNNRNKRGGTTKSVHAWAAAIDLDADHNAFKQSWPVQATMPLEIMECFAREGWLSAAAFWGYDGMHHQATR